MRNLICCLICFISATVSVYADSTSYVYRLLSQVDGYKFSAPNQINNRGQVVGYVMDYNNNVKAAFWDADGSVRTLWDGGRAYGINDRGDIVGRRGNDAVMLKADGTLVTLKSSTGTDVCIAMGINNYGDVVGYSSALDYSSIIPYKWNWDGTSTRLAAQSDYPWGIATSINDTGMVAGRAGLPDSPNTMRAAYWDAAGELNLLSTPYWYTRPQSYSYTVGVTNAINNSGIIVGLVVGVNTRDEVSVWTPNGERAVLDRYYTDSTQQQAYDINDLNQIVGLETEPTDNRFQPILWDADGTILKLDMPAGMNWSYARSINNSGMIAGCAAVSDPNYGRVVIWTPVPEPAGVVTLASALIAAGGLIRRKTLRTHR